MEIKNFITLSLISIVFLISFSCREATVTIVEKNESSRMLLECLIRVAVKADKSFDPKLHYLQVVQEHRTDLDCNTLTIQRHELSSKNESSSCYEAVYNNDVIIQFTYLDNSTGRLENRVMDSLVIDNKLEWKQTSTKNKTGIDIAASGYIYDPWINVNILYDAYSQCVIDSVMYATLKIDSQIRNECELCD